ncbi:unnamed protein product [Polarella glacialis]|uniref:Uncharacterized protein n=1 Tax=Polarella glacialis TaxID=89957 RepID=A0A813GBS3_POLGL|nr:unnamed protein product [Polarella glacialis]CAE8676418.1 unnamed protein product [Polarella glacialis]
MICGILFKMWFSHQSKPHKSDQTADHSGKRASTSSHWTMLEEDQAQSSPNEGLHPLLHSWPAQAPPEVRMCDGRVVHVVNTDGASRSNTRRSTKQGSAPLGARPTC